MASSFTSLKDFYWNRVEKGGENDCWNWLGQKDASGAGIFRIGKSKILAKSIAWEELHGPLPGGMYLANTCGNLSCVNPNHYILKQKGQLLCGASRNLASRVSSEAKKQVYALYKQGIKPGEIAKTLGFGRSTVYHWLKEGGLLANKKGATLDVPATTTAVTPTAPANATSLKRLSLLTLQVLARYEDAMLDLILTKSTDLDADERRLNEYLSKVREAVRGTAT